MAYPEPIAPNSIAPRPAINQQQGDLWAAIAAASAHLPEVKAAMHIIDEALSGTAPSLAATTANSRPTTSDATLLSALHNGTLTPHPHHPKRTSSATPRGNDPNRRKHSPTNTASPMDTRNPHLMGDGRPLHEALPPTNQHPPHQLTRPGTTYAPPWETRTPPAPWWQRGRYVEKSSSRC